MEHATWHIFVVGLLIPDWIEIRAPSRRNLRKHLNEIDPLSKQRQLIYINNIYIYLCINI